MKNVIFTFCTKNIEPFKINFYSTLIGDYEINHEYIDVLIEDKAGGGIKIWEYKISKILDLINCYFDKDIKITVFDLDIQFFGDISPLIDQLFDKYQLDMAFQAESIFHGANIGVCVMKPNGKTRQFWRDVYARLKNTKEWDQSVVNQYIWRNGIENYKDKNIKIGILPGEIYACSSFGISDNIVLHHANCTSDFNEKWNQFVFLRKIINKNFEFKHEYIQNFLKSNKITFSSLDSKKYQPCDVHILDFKITIPNYGIYFITYNNEYMALHYENGQIFAMFDHLIYDNHFDNYLLMGYFCNIGKVRGIYNRCYFIF